MEHIIIPEILCEICGFLSQEELRLTSATQDGRINSSINEDEILNCLDKCFKFSDGYELQRPNAREWYDFVIEKQETKEFYPINIKVTDTTHSDNLNCKLGIYYALTGKKPSFTNEISWLPYFEKLHDNFGASRDKDYYFLVVNKRDVSDVFCTTLRGLQAITPNGNNLPFQCMWSRNRNLYQRNFDQSAEFILKTLGESIKQRSSIYFNFKKYFAQYV